MRTLIGTSWWVVFVLSAQFIQIAMAGDDVLMAVGVLAIRWDLGVTGAFDRGGTAVEERAAGGGQCHTSGDPGESFAGLHRIF